MNSQIAASRKNGTSVAKRPKGHAPWNPQEKTRAILAQVQEVLREYRNYLPMTARQIFYRLVGNYGYEKTEQAYERLTNYLVRARRTGIIPWKAIRDDGASVMEPVHYASEDAFWGRVRGMAQRYERDKLARQRADIRVYCEAAGMMPQLHQVCAPYSVAVYSCSGFDSLSAKYDLKEDCRRNFTYRGKKTVILHLGDYDPSGESIFNDGLVEDIHAFLQKDVAHKNPEDIAVFERVALLPEHIGLYGLETAPPKKSDSRTERGRGEVTCQLEALPPDTLADLLEDAITEHLDTDVYEQDLEEEEQERQRIARALPAPSN